MKCTISATEPHILREAKPGDLFVLHDPYWHECVCAVVEHYGPCAPPAFIRVVCVACRVDEGEFGWHRNGDTLTAHSCAAITLVEQVESTAFRERASGQTDAQREALRLVNVLVGDETLAVEPTKQETRVSVLPAFVLGVSYCHGVLNTKQARFEATVHIPRSMRTADRIDKFLRDLIQLVNTSFNTQSEKPTPINGEAV